MRTLGFRSSLPVCKFLTLFPYHVLLQWLELPVLCWTAMAKVSSLTCSLSWESVQPFNIKYHVSLVFFIDVFIKSRKFSLIPSFLRGFFLIINGYCGLGNVIFFCFSWYDLVIFFFSSMLIHWIAFITSQTENHFASWSKTHLVTVSNSFHILLNCTW